MQNSWVVLVPPAVVLIASFATKRILLALVLGIISAGFIASDFQPIQSLLTIKSSFLEQFTFDNCYIFAFLTALGILITLMSYTGGTSAYGNIIRKFIKTARSSQFASMLLSLLLIFDDFFSSITTGCIMRPLTDHFKVPRIKLAYLIDSMAAPLVIAIPISTWTATLTMQLAKAGVTTHGTEEKLINADPFIVYMESIPFIFYTFIILISTFFIVQKNISYGIMAEHEKIAQDTGNLFGGKPERECNLTQCPSSNGSLIDFFLPIGLLLFNSFLILLYRGDYYLLGGHNSFANALYETDIFYALCYGSVSALLLSTLWYLIRKKISLPALPGLLAKGSMVMLDSIQILFLAWMFSDLLTHNLNSGTYLANLAIGLFPLTLLPVIFFIITSITSIAIGSSWGTIAVMIPLAIPMLIQMKGLGIPTTPAALPMLFPLIGAIFAGAIAGDHVSPLSSTTVMSSTSSGAYHHDHVISQLQYAAPVFLGCIVAYILAGILITKGIWIALGISFSSGLFVCLFLLSILDYLHRQRLQKA